jgi:hypothetical protein
MVLKKQNQKNKKLEYKRGVKYFAIPIFLAVLWLALSLLNVNKNAGLTVLAYPHGIKDTKEWKTQELLAGEKATGEFTARDNNLGIVAVRFNTFFRINDDVVRFRIKDKGDKSWDYENDYTTPQFQPNQLFTFGFPIIPDSSGKTYEFEIESLQGERENAVALSTITPVYVTKYQYAKELILSDRDYATTFLYKKTLNSVTNADFLLASFAYALPLLVYLIWLLFFNKYLYNKYRLVFVPIILMLAVAVMDATRNDSIVLGLTLLWGFTALAYRLQSTISLSLALILVMLSPVLLYLSLDDFSKNIAMWGYLLLVVGVAQAIWEMKTNNKKLVSLSEFAQKIGLKKFFKK